MPDVAEREGLGETRTWKVHGMDCASCVAKVEKAVSRLSGVGDIQVNLMAETLTARLGPGSDSEAVARTVAALGYHATLRKPSGPASSTDRHSHAGHDHAGHDHSGHDHAAHEHDHSVHASGAAQTTTWRVRGMDCASCVAKVEKAVSRLPGVGDIQVNLMAETLTARLYPGTDPAAVASAVGALGYKATLRQGAGRGNPLPIGDHAGHDHANHDHSGHDQGRAEGEAHAGGHLHAHGDDEEEPGALWWRTGKAKLVWLLGGLVAAAYGGSLLFPAEAYWIFVVATLVAVFPFGRRALALARAGSPFSIETLMVVAAVGAVVIGAAEEAAIVVLLFAVGEMLENVAAGQARSGIKALVDLIPRTARVERDGAIAEVPADRLSLGNIVQARPGDRIPCDGVIVEGQSAVDESPVTGESVPVARGPGEAVVAGSVNTAALLRIRVTATAADNTLSRIVKMVEEATASRAPTQRFIEKFSIYWTPGAMIMSVLVILVPPLLFGGDWGTWVYRGLAVLLIACPCALVISVPAAMASGLSAGARRGLLVKGGAALETIGKATTVAFDKTGTLTAGRPRVTDVLPAPGVDEAALLGAAAAVEAGSAHPLAIAVLQAAEARGIQPVPATEAGAVPGKAATAVVGGALIAVGSPTYAAEQGADLSIMSARVQAFEEAGKTAVVVLRDGRALGVIALRDEPRDDARSAVAALKGMGVASVMLTGDNERTGRAIAGALGMDVRAGLLPDQKLREIEALKASGPVVMVGDGINDAPALAAASVGVAMGGGTAVALETADAALLRERVSGVVELVALSRATLSNIKQNVAVAVGLKLVFLATTLTGTTGLWLAILADTGATVLVTLNALRLLGWKSPVGNRRGTPPSGKVAPVLPQAASDKAIVGATA
ncbi:heavy metal translocating P-type ATPase [Acidisoma sp. S159]|uniref:heavy metal translocating P-type ATPase n=1 Tax=Acidisoma sp. S159 TaxID=1747225 RepID=UPI00131DEFE0|nr:heavy metal translocating P-type ATPase [Acidisoma sp. S159]